MPVVTNDVENFSCQRPRVVGNRGFSLLELVFALVIVATVVAIVVPRLQQGMELHLRASSRKIASTIRFCYFESVAKNHVFRMVFSMDPQDERIWLEIADKPVRIRSPQKEEEFARRLESVSVEEREAILAREPQFIKLEGAGELKLPRGVFLKDVYVDHQPGRIERGLAYLYFFPNGNTERAVINIQDKDGNVYNLQVHALTGKTAVNQGYVDYAQTL